MATVTVSWTTVPQNFPAGTIIGKTSVVLSGPSAGTMMVDASPAVFPNVNGDDPNNPYQAIIQLLDGAGNALGAALTVKSVEPVVGQVPDTGSVTIAP